MQRLRRLLPEPGEVSTEEATSGLRLGELAPPDRPYLVLNMVASLDGKATLEGRTAGLGGEADRELFHGLRTQADALLVGAGTVRAERYGRVVRDPALRERRRGEGLAEDPLACVVSASLEGLADVPLLEAAEQRVVVVTAAEDELPLAAPPVEYLRAPRAAASAVASEEGASASGAVDARAALERLRADWGVRSVLCEGGPTLNADLLAAGVVDELFLSLSPQLLGGREALTIVAGDALPEPVPLELVSLLESGSELFLRLCVRHA